MDPRRLAVAIACSLVVAGAVLLLALAQRSPAPAQTPKACGKPLTGNPPLRFDLPARFVGSSPARLRTLGDPASNVDLAPGVDARTDLAPAAIKLGHALQSARSQERESVLEALRPLVIALVALALLALVATLVAVVQVVQPGYTIGERVLRPALVAIAKGGPKSASASAEAPANDNAGLGEPRG